MLSENLPKYINPIQLAKESLHLEGNFAFTALPRLQAAVHNPAGRVDFSFDFGWQQEANQKIYFMQGVIHTQVELICQRCLQPVSVILDCNPLLLLVRAQQNMPEIPDNYEILELETESIALATLVEDELILNLPIAAYHEICPLNDYQLAENWQEFQQQNNPFRILHNLKTEH
jgi:uncharacterized protein